MKKIELKIYGNPKAQARPRFFRRGNFVGTYEPKDSKGWKESIQLQAIAQKVEFLQGALSMSLHFFFMKPKSMPKKIYYHVKKPDLDNCVKACKDALKGICYRDDSQIVRLIAEKEYNAQPGVIIDIWEMEDGQQHEQPGSRYNK